MQGLTVGHEKNYNNCIKLPYSDYPVDLARILGHVFAVGLCEDQLIARNSTNTY